MSTLVELRKSFVGGGQARSITSLSPRALKVLRRNLEGERALRHGTARPYVGLLTGQVRDMPKTRPVSRMQRNTDRLITSQLSATGSRSKDNMLLRPPERPIGPTKQTWHPNVRVENPDQLTARGKRVLERGLGQAQRAGLKLRSPVVLRPDSFDFTRSSVPASARSSTVAATTSHAGKLKTIGLSNGAHANEETLVHELYHASGKPNRRTLRNFRKRPKLSGLHEEAAADGFAARATGSKGEYRSGYAQAAKPGGEYDKVFERVSGRKPRVPLRRANQWAERKVAQRAAQRDPKAVSVRLGGSSKKQAEATDRYNRAWLDRQRDRIEW